MSSPLSQRRPGLSTPLRIAVLAMWLMSAAMLSGCRDNPEIVLQQAREALKNKEPETFLALVDPPSRRFLLRAQQVVRRSGQTYEVLGAKGFAKDLLPAGDLIEDQQTGSFCVISRKALCNIDVKKGRSKVRVPLRLIRGQWRIAMLEMEPFLQAVLPR